MDVAAGKPSMSAQDFLAWDATQTVRHEFIAGGLRVLHGEDEPQLAGTGEAHVTVAGNLYVALRQQLAGTPCRTFITDMKLRVEAADAFFYPGVMVCCSAADAADPLIKRDPLLLVEVLSPATAAYDRGDKFAAYRKLPGLREYLLVDTDSRRCDLYRKGNDGLWVLHPFEPGQPLRLAPRPQESPAYRHLGFIDALEALLGRHADVLGDGPIENPHLRHAVNASRRVLHDEPAAEASLQGRLEAELARFPEP